MTSLVTREVDFSCFEKPQHRDPFAIGEHLISLVSAYVKYGPDIYRPDLALQKGEGNCYAWAQLGAIALESWEMPSAVVLSRTHAHLAAKIHESILFIDLTTSHTNDIKREAQRQNGLNKSSELERLYRELLPRAFADGEFTLFFRKEFDGVGMTWQGDRRRTIASDRPEADYCESTAHLIFSADQAEDVLQAIGDLKRYFELDSPKFQERMDELAQYIPDFVGFNDD